MAGLIPRGIVGPEHLVDYTKFICPPTEPTIILDPLVGPVPFTPDIVAPDRRFFRKLIIDFNIALPFTLPGIGGNLPMWIIGDEAPNPVPNQYPSPLIRAVQGEIVHNETSTRQGPHTIHHHGIEPTPCNDGVGKLSFEIEGRYTYQWLAAEPGTYFYHCHRNTPLHFEMGLFGLIIIDPRNPGGMGVPNPPYPAGGPGLVVGQSPSTNHLIRYDREVLWVPDEMDSQWHLLGHNAFMADCLGDPNNPQTFTQDGILHLFRPDVFVVTGAVRRNDTTVITDTRAAINASAGETVLIRLLNAGYTTHQYTLPFDVDVIAMDGRPLGVPPRDRYSRPFTVPAGRPFRLTTARRWDLIMRPNVRGSFTAKMDFYNWTSGRRHATALVAVNIT